MQLDTLKSCYVGLATDIGEMFEDKGINFDINDFHDDIVHLLRRVQCEGYPFITRMLPQLAKAILAGLESGRFDIPAGFRRAGRGDSRPKMFRTLISFLFDKESNILDYIDGSEIALKAILQICKLFYKTEFDIDTKHLEKKKLDEWLDIEHSLDDITIDPKDPVLSIARSFINLVFSTMPRILPDPKHGPGAVAEHGVKGSDKWNFNRIPSLNRVFPFHKWFLTPESTYIEDSRSKYPYKELETSFLYHNIVLPGSFGSPCELYSDYLNRKLSKLECVNHTEEYEPLARMAFVPKNAEGPRIISMEPKERMFIQQSLKSALYHHLEKQCPLTKGLVNFTDQSINQSLVKHMSIFRTYATVDLSAASDRVSLDLIKVLLQDQPVWLEYLLASRSPVVELPNQQPHLLRKFAGMGSAVTFPLEALCFYSILKGIQVIQDGASLDRLLPIFVYGDDIILPKNLYGPMLKTFPKYGLKVNVNKSFLHSHFRESCGIEAFHGHEVTPTYIRKLKDSRDHLSFIGDDLKYYMSLNATAWIFFHRGYITTAKVLCDYLDTLTPWHVRRHIPESQVNDTGFLVKPPFSTHVPEFGFSDDYFFESSKVKIIKNFSVLRNSNDPIYTNLQIQNPILVLYPKVKPEKKINNTLTQEQRLLSGLLGPEPPLSIATNNVAGDKIKGINPFRLQRQYVPSESLLSHKELNLAQNMTGSVLGLPHMNKDYSAFICDDY